jgi:hypothetical protein
MTMFNWQANNGEAVVSSHIWLYFVIAGLLTIAVIGIWVLWYKLVQEKLSKRRYDDVETAIILNSK